MLIMFECLVLIQHSVTFFCSVCLPNVRDVQFTVQFIYMQFRKHRFIVMCGC